MAWIDKIYCSIEQWKELIKFLQKHQRRIYKKTNIKYPLNRCYGICWEKKDTIIFNLGSNLELYLYRKCRIPYILESIEERYSESYIKYWQIKKEKVGWKWNEKMYSNKEIKEILNY